MMAHDTSKDVFGKPMKQGSGIAPRWSQEVYRGIPLHPDVKRRLDEYAAIPSLSAADIARMLT